MGRWGAIAVLIFAGAARAQAPIQLTKVAGGFAQPTHIAGAGDASGRLFVVEQAGRIRIVRNGTVAATPFLDITDRVRCCGEQGLLSVAFPPGYPAKPHFYVYYTALTGDVTVSRFGLGANADTADPASETVILTVSHRQYQNHNGGQLVFGPDGYLYVGTGDGGGGGDPLGNAQNTNALLGKILRLDVEGGAATYSIPPGNPFASQAGRRGEIWAYGLRNPWRFSFDRTTGDLYIGDVGQNLYEEVDVQPAASAGGQNYGWNRMEGLHCYQAACDTSGLTLPVTEYTHDGGNCSITGGFVYRGTQYPAVAGTYLYADYCSGRIWAMTRVSGVWLSAQVLASGLNISSFGQDDTGELYLADQGHGDIYHIEGPAPAVGIGAVVNAASFAPGLAPGALASVFGVGLVRAAGIVNAPPAPLPVELDGVSVEVNGTPAPLLAVARVNGLEQINFQIPFETALGTTSFVVKNGAASSAVFQAKTTAVAPALFTTDGSHAAAQHGTDYRPIAEGDGAAAGEAILLYGTGLGPVSNAPATGGPAPLQPLAETAMPAVTIGGLPATVEFSGLTPFLVGVDQINVRVPAGLAAGDQAVVVTIGGTSSKPVRIAVR
jgi:uncharacterized protein (TIGR03437 family)